MIVYICGPMTGYEDLNQDAFDTAAALLRAIGAQPVNPHDIDRQAGVDITAPVTRQAHREAMRRDIPQVANCDALYLLNGWEYSDGAFNEFVVARACGARFYYQANPFDIDRLKEDLQLEGVHVGAE